MPDDVPQVAAVLQSSNPRFKEISGVESFLIKLSFNRETTHLVGSRPVIRVRTKNPLLIPVPNHIISPHIIIPYFVQVHFNIILQPTPRFLKWSLSFRFRTKILYAFLIAHMRATCPDILFSFIWSLQVYLVNRTNYEFPPDFFFIFLPYSPLIYHLQPRIQRPPSTFFFQGEYLIVCVLLTVYLSITLVNDQLDAKFFYFIIRLLQSSTCFEQRRAHHHQEVNL